MRRISKNKVVYSFSPKDKPVEHVGLKEEVLVETVDALGGQVEAEDAPIKLIDWSRINGATGPIFIDGVKSGDTLVVNIEKITITDRGVIVIVPKQGALGDKQFRAEAKVVPIRDENVFFESGLRLKACPMIGTIGVAPLAEEIPTGSSGRHGGNMDVKEIVSGTRLYLPVFADGALFALGDLHAVQADGEVCVSAVEVSGEVLLNFDVIKGKHVPWPVLETRDSYAFLVCGDSLDEAVVLAVDVAVEVLMREHRWSFEKAYMFASLAVDVKINQVVDPKKGVRASIPKNFISLESLSF